MMLTANDVRGVIPAIVTPFNEEDEVDDAALRQITNYVIEAGVHGILTTGGTGEFAHLSRAEKQAVTMVVADEARGRVPVTAGTGACSTREVLQLTQDAAEAGAAAALVRTPYYYELHQEALREHYSTLAREGALPIIVYNYPGHTGNNLAPALLAELAEEEGIIGIKQANEDLGQLIECIRLAGDKISVCTGCDSQFYASLCVGGQGIFAAAAGIIPRQMVLLYEATTHGRHDEALAIHHRIQPLVRFVESELGYVAPCKEVLNLLGLPAGKPRVPLSPLTAEQRQQIKTALADIGLLPD